MHCEYILLQGWCNNWGSIHWCVTRIVFVTVLKWRLRFKIWTCLQGQLRREKQRGQNHQLQSWIQIWVRQVHLRCCASASLGHTASPQFNHGFFSPVLHSEHKIFLFSSSDTLSSITISFLPHLVNSNLLSLLLFPSLFLHFHAPRYFVHTFFNCFPETNSCQKRFNPLTAVGAHGFHLLNLLPCQ